MGAPLLKIIEATNFVASIIFAVTRISGIEISVSEQATEF